MFDIKDTPREISSIATSGAKIVVIGVGGGGCNAVNTMIREGLDGVRYIVANTDVQALNASLAEKKIQLGIEITKGLGAGANPEVGKQAAMEDYETIAEALSDVDMVFITAGMGGGTGTGAAPIIAKLSKDLGALTVGVVTKPFRFEGKKRKRQADTGIEELEASVDSLITIPNEKLLELAGDNLTLVETFRAADGILLNAVRGISDLINNTGLINSDFADVATVMKNTGMALMGTGEATGENRAEEATKKAINSPLLDDVSIEGATGIIVNISGDSSLTTSEINQAMNLITDEADENAEFIFGAVIDETLADTVKVTVVATGLGGKRFTHDTPDTSMNNFTRPVERESLFSQKEKLETEKSYHDTAGATLGVIGEQEAEDFINKSFSDFEITESKNETENETEEEVLFFDGSVQTEPEESDNKDFVQAMNTKEPISDISDETEADDEPEVIEEEKGFGRAKRLAQKLGFMNFDDEEFDKPVHERDKETDA